MFIQSYFRLKSQKRCCVLCHSSFSLMASSSASVSSSSGWPTLASGSGGPQGAGSKKLAPGSFSTLSDRRTPLKQSHQIDGNAQRQQSAFRWTKNQQGVRVEMQAGEWDVQRMETEVVNHPQTLSACRLEGKTKNSQASDHESAYNVKVQVRDENDPFKQFTVTVGYSRFKDPEGKTHGWAMFGAGCKEMEQKVQGVVFLLNVCGFEAPKRILYDPAAGGRGADVQHTFRHYARPKKKGPKKPAKRLPAVTPASGGATSSTQAWLDSEPVPPGPVPKSGHGMPPPPAAAKLPGAVPTVPPPILASGGSSGSGSRMPPPPAAATLPRAVPTIPPTTPMPASGGESGGNTPQLQGAVLPPPPFRGSVLRDMPQQPQQQQQQQQQQPTSEPATKWARQAQASGSIEPPSQFDQSPPGSKMAHIYVAMKQESQPSQPMLASGSTTAGAAQQQPMHQGHPQPQPHPVYQRLDESTLAAQAAGPMLATGSAQAQASQAMPQSQQQPLRPAPQTPPKQAPPAHIMKQEMHATVDLEDELDFSPDQPDPYQPQSWADLEHEEEEEEEEQQQPQLASGGVGVADDESDDQDDDEDDQPASGNVTVTIDRDTDNREPWEIYSSAEPWTQDEIDEFKRLVSQVVRKSKRIIHRVAEGKEYDRFASASGDVDEDIDLSLALADEVYQWGYTTQVVVEKGIQEMARIGLGFQKEVLDPMQVGAMLIQDFPEDPSGTHSRPLATMTWADKETFLKDLMSRHRGEIRGIECQWVEVHEPFPDVFAADEATRENARLWFHEQFCADAESARVLNTFTKGGVGRGSKGLASVAKGLGKGKKGGGDAAGDTGAAGHWQQNMANRIVKPHDEDDNIHLVRQARCFNLAMVFKQLGDSYTAKTLYHWYCSQEIIAMKRHHGAADPVRQAAAQERKGATGRYGFGRGKSAYQSAAGDDDKGWKGSQGQSQKGWKSVKGHKKK